MIYVVLSGFAWLSYVKVTRLYVTFLEVYVGVSVAGHALTMFYQPSDLPLHAIWIAGVPALLEAGRRKLFKVQQSS